ncbi:hypothetical protein FGO68_gene7928 [Halteria grandinella]|uniref:Uncharacterized protein n=1 Tax=Halteria grandinella TaxID=5974 RepID=A0A8J8NUA2_HALGN|nr:hypothetical protein FGO68_gene7928 [Halteria grandinella]
MVKSAFCLVALFLTLASCEIQDITLENQMKLFMDHQSILGEWLAYFDEPKYCKGRTCKKAKEELPALDSLLREQQSSLRIAKINCALTQELCVILQINTQAGPQLVYFTSENEAYTYNGTFQASEILNEFIEGKAYKKHEEFSGDLRQRIFQGIKRLTTQSDRIIPEGGENINPLVLHFQDFVNSIFQKAGIQNNRWSQWSKNFIALLFLSGPIISFMISKVCKFKKSN